MKWTDSQQEILDFERPCDLLISAAAGSGKTAVMTERIRQRTMAGKVEMSEILVMTFTNYAAQGMRERIEKSFRQALQHNLTENGDQSERENINKQMMQLQQAQISTVHAFCIRILQTYGSELTDRSGIPLFESGFGVLEDTRRQILLDQAVDSVLSWCYERSAELENNNEESDWSSLTVGGEIPQHDDELAPFCLLQESISRADWIRRFNLVCDMFSYKKDDSSLRAELTGQLNRLRSICDYEEWTRHQLQIQAASAGCFCKSNEYDAFMLMVEQALSKSEKGIDQLKSCIYYDILLDPDNKIGEDLYFRDLLTEQTAAIRQIRSILDEPEGLSDQNGQSGMNICKWDKIKHMADMLREPKLLPRRGNDKKELAIIYNTSLLPLIFMLKGKPDISKIDELQIEKPLHLFAADTAMIERDLQQMLPALSCFFELVLMIDRAYLRLKIQEQAIDFSDFEHFALRLLRKKEIGDSYRHQFKEIYLDEYQDTNNIQESIINEIAHENIFMVGDIKQSIYRFRFANPALFSEKADRFRSNPSVGCLMTLNQNFRSVPGIIHGVNRIFERFLTFECGEIDYDENQALVPFRESSGDQELPFQLLLVNTEENSNHAPPTESVAMEEKSAEKEALAVIRQIRQLIEEGRCSYGDIAILGRTNDLCTIYFQQLQDYGIPVTASGERTFLDSPELRLLESLINLLDNMQQDIPLASIMRSGLVQPGFSESELLEIRIDDQHLPQEQRMDSHFYAAVLRYETTGSNPDLRNKIAEFLRQIRRWRQKEQYLGIAELLGLIYDESGYPDRVSCLPFGESRVSDLERFQEWAAGFEKSRQKGLFDFARYIQKIKEQKIRETGFDQVSSADNAVRIMTVHGSKGLEFPVVFLVGIQKQMVRSQSGQILQVSEQGGITSMSVNPDDFESHQTVSNYWHELNAARAERAEAYRLLYVGMTRAENRLYLVGNVSLKSNGGSPARLNLLEKVKNTWTGNTPLPADLVIEAKSWLDLILMGIACEKELDPSVWFDAGGAESSDLIQSNQYFRICLISINELRSQLYSKRPTLAAREKLEAINSLDQQPAVLKLELDQLTDLWYQRLKPDYRYEGTARLPGKITVSGLKRLQEQMLIEQSFVNHDIENLPDLSMVVAASKYAPEINMELHTAELNEEAEKSRLTPAELGTMLHTIFQFLDLPALGENPESQQIKAQITAMADNRQLPARHLEQALLWSESVLTYVGSDLATAIRRCEIESPGKVFREMPFTLALPAEMAESSKIESSLSELISTQEQDLTLIQGMIDCWYESDEGVVLVDFKSDYLTGDQFELKHKLTDRYGLQLAAYALAIQKATGKSVNKRIIWLIRRGMAVEI